MKRVLKCIVVGVILIAALWVVGILLEMDRAYLSKASAWIIILVVAWGLKGRNKSKQQERFAELKEKHGKTVLGFIQKPARLRAQFLVLMVVMLAFLVFLAAVFIWGCMNDDIPDMETVVWMTVGLISLVGIIILCWFGVKKYSRVIAYGEDFVVIYYGKDEKMLQWSDFGSCKKFGAQMRFYDRNGNKLFAEEMATEGYEDFWKLYQKHVEGKSDEEIAAEKYAK